MKSISKKLRIFKAFPAYETYINAFYAENNGMATLSFNEQLNALAQDCFPWILTWSKFNTNSNVHIFETVHNAYYLQDAWMKEHSFLSTYDNQNWQKTIILRQIKDCSPDVVIIYPPELFDESFIAEIKSLNRNILIGGYDGMNRQNVQKYNGYDFVITCSSYISRYYESHNILTYPLEFAFDTSVSNRLKESERSFSVGFSGSITPHLHQNRFELLSYMVKRTPIVISSEYTIGNIPSFNIKHTLKAIGRWDKSYFDAFLIYLRNIGPKYGIAMYQFLKDSKICLNAHGSEINFAANVRLYEATGVGSCLLTDWKENIGEIFEPGKEIVTYSSKEEAVDKIRFLIRHDNERKRIASKGRERTLENYTYTKRIEGVIQFIQSIL